MLNTCSAPSVCRMLMVRKGGDASSSLGPETHSPSGSGQAPDLMDAPGVQPPSAGEWDTQPVDMSAITAMNMSVRRPCVGFAPWIADGSTSTESRASNTGEGVLQCCRA